jgi:hypothetical protein
MYLPFTVYSAFSINYSMAKFGDLFGERRQAWQSTIEERL